MSEQETPPRPLEAEEIDPNETDQARRKRIQKEEEDRQKNPQ